MGLHLDLSELRAVGTRVATAGPRVGGAASAILRKTAMDIEGDAKAAAPVDTGNLRNSISTSVEGDGRSGAMSAEIGPTAEYGVYVEYGTSRMGAQPYLGPAFDRRVAGYTGALASAAAAQVL